MRGKNTRCKSCGASCTWVTTESGKTNLFDEMPDPAGRWVLDDDNVAHYVGMSKYVSGDRYTSHWATCPHADQHRKPKAS